MTTSEQIIAVFKYMTENGFWHFLGCLWLASLIFKFRLFTIKSKSVNKAPSVAALGEILQKAFKDIDEKYEDECEEKECEEKTVTPPTAEVPK